MPITYDILSGAIDHAKKLGLTVVKIHINSTEVRIPLSLAETWLTDLI
jgi:hypothetical protein